MSKTFPKLAEERKFPRRHFDRNLGVLFQGQYKVCSGFDIGEGGLSFMAEEQFPEDAIAVVNFQVPGGGFTSAIVHIRRSVRSSSSDQFVVSCTFRDVSFEIKREIRTYVSARA